MAYTPATDVCWYLSTITLPLSTLIPTSSKPRFSILATTPTALNTTSASSVTIEPSCFLTCALTPAPVVSNDSTDALVIISMPCFLYCFSNSLEMSSSSTGTMRGINSTMVTLVPMLLYTYANSTPIAPLPTMIIDFGCSASTIASR